MTKTNDAESGSHTLSAKMISADSVTCASFSNIAASISVRSSLDNRAGSLCLVAQRAKAMMLGSDVLDCDAARLLVFAVDLPGRRSGDARQPA